MKLEKAIEISENEQRRNYTERGNPIYEAHQLLIEAGKRIEAIRASLAFCPGLLLPGETEE